MLLKFICNLFPCFLYCLSIIFFSLSIISFNSTLLTDIIRLNRVVKLKESMNNLCIKV